MVSKKVMERVVQISKLNLNKKEKEKFSKNLDDILKAFSSLDKVNVKGVEPTFQPIEVKNVLRDDEVEPSLSQKEALSNAKHKKKGYFKGPRVV